MCLNPRKILNKGYNPDDIFSPYYLTVPCGHCKECQEARISEVLFRADWENFETVSLGGFCIFTTLTFNEQNLNYLTYEHGTDVKTISTWDNKSFTKWRNSLNMWLSRNNASLRYLKSCERGSNDWYIDERGHMRKATSRPHYHVILWIKPTNSDFSLTPDKVFDKLTSLWSNKPRHNESVDISTKVPNSRFVARHEPKGYVYNELVVRNNDVNKATKYVVGYCIKTHTEDMNHIHDEDCLSSTLKISLNDSLPRYSCSNGLGLFYEMCNDLSDPIRVSELISCTSDGQKTLIPRYYIKRLSQRIDVVNVQELHTIKLNPVYKHYNKKGKEINADVIQVSWFRHFADTKVIFDGEKRYYRCDGTEYVPGRIHHYSSRPAPETKTRITPYGYSFRNAVHYNDCVKSWQSLQFWIHSKFTVESIDFDKLPFSDQYDKKTLTAIKNIQGCVSRFHSGYRHALSSLDFDTFCGLYSWVHHMSYADIRCSFMSGKFSDVVPDGAYTYEAFYYFNELRKLESRYIKSSSRWNLEQEYKTRGLKKALETNPYPFLPRLVS